ncbi:hypothetical protein [Vibrio bivalvicida]|uniref:Uncharacterized protein n=1 Tax=Vibrio bivalvicida TaxID=1276888 RepID=A0ABV4MLL3_9VIBR
MMELRELSHQEELEFAAEALDAIAKMAYERGFILSASTLELMTKTGSYSLRPDRIEPRLKFDLNTPPRD